MVYDDERRASESDYPLRKPVYPGYLADPCVFEHAGMYYMIGTGSPDRPLVNGRCFPGLYSRDFEHWEYAGHCLLQPDTRLGDSYWAPEVTRVDGSFYLYYSVGFDDKRHHLRVAVSDHPMGPYVDSGTALTDLERLPFAIDPHPFQDFDGARYLFYARDFLDYDNGAGAGTALVVDRLTDMLHLAGDERTVLRSHHEWQRFMAERPMYGQHWDWRTLEGPCVWIWNDRYYCFYSGGRWDSDRYGVDYAVASTVTGPYEDTNREAHARITRSIPGRIIGPGHNTIVLGPDEHTSYIAYHAWNNERTIRSPYLSALGWDESGPLPVVF